VRTASDLNDLDTTDTDALDTDPFDTDELERRQQSFVTHAVKFGRVALLLVVIWLLTGGPFWPVWPIAFLALGLAKRAQMTTATSSRRGHKRHSCFL
jgi:hypothetical protein